jgi:hypothetical protein
METRKLTPENIEYLFRIVEQNGVKYYDVQAEMVDHFASAVERNWERNPNATFAESFIEEYKQLKEIDFELIQTEKEAALQKKYKKIQRSYIQDFFSWPKIALTTFITYIVYQSFFLFSNYLNFIVLIVLLDFLLIAIVSFFVYPRKFSIELRENKKFLIIEQLHTKKYNFMAVGKLPAGLLGCMFSFNNQYHFTFIENPTFKIFVAFLVVMSIVFFIATGFYVPSRIKVDFIREYPQFVKT